MGSCVNNSCSIKFKHDFVPEAIMLVVLATKYSEIRSVEWDQAGRMVLKMLLLLDNFC